MKELVRVDSLRRKDEVLYKDVREYSGTATTLECTGRVNPGDGAGGIFHLRETSTAADDGGTVLVDSLGRRWVREYTGYKNVIWFGADPTGSIDSAPALSAAGTGSYIPAGVYRADTRVQGTFLHSGGVKITGDGNVRTVPADSGTNLHTLPIEPAKALGGLMYTQGGTSVTANTSEYYREPIVQHTQSDNRTYLVYSVLIGTRYDPGQDANQTSRIEIRSSNNNLDFREPVVVSTDGEPQAAEPSFVFDRKRGRLWVFYTTARGKVGVGHGSVGFDPASTFQTWVTYSDTYGSTWSSPQNITTLVKPYSATSAWTPPSSICVTGDGDLLVPYTCYYGGPFEACYIKVHTKADGTLEYTRHVIRETGFDGNWGGGEHQIIQLGDGSLLCMLRDYYKSGSNTIGRQQFLRSYDGVNWSRQSYLDSSNCKAGMCLYSSIANGDSKDVILVTAPTGNDDSNLYRNNLKLWASTDRGLTWQKFDASVFGSAGVSTGYSAITPLSAGACMVVAEGSQYQTLGVRHFSLGTFSKQSTFARSWGGVQVVQSAAEASLCQYFDIPQYTLYWNTDENALKLNVSGTPVRVTDTNLGVDVTSPSTFLNSSLGSVYYCSVSMTLNEITGNSSKIMIVSTTSSQPVVLQESASIPIERRIRVNKTLSAQAIVLYRTKYGWYASA